MEEQEDNNTYRLSIDLARKDGKSMPKIKFTVVGNTREEFESNLAYLKGIAMREAGY
jgi:hypothetical protein